MNPSPLANPLATPAQLEISSSQLDGIPSDLETSIRFASARLTQAAGILLRLPQEVIAQAIVILTRFWVGPEGASLAEFGAEQISASSLYLTTKLSAYPKSARSVANVYAYLRGMNFASHFHSPDRDQQLSASQIPENYQPESGYEYFKRELFSHEAHILRILGFQTSVTLPYTLAITYLQALDVFSDHESGSRLAKRAIARLNDALFSPQLLYLTHQPPSLAAAAIYLAAKETGVKLPDVEWWEVFDVEREELGFLVVAMLSVATFAEEEKRKWEGRYVPMFVAEVEEEANSIREYRAWRERADIPKS